MDALRSQLYELIDRYGNTDPRTVAKSQELDILVNQEIKKALCKGQT